MTSSWFFLPQSPRYFTRQPKTPVLQSLWSSYLSQMNAASRQQTAGHYPQLHLSYCRNTPTYVRARDVAHIPGCRTLRIESCYKARSLSCVWVRFSIELPVLVGLCVSRTSGTICRNLLSSHKISDSNSWDSEHPA